MKNLIHVSESRHRFLTNNSTSTSTRTTSTTSHRTKHNDFIACLLTNPNVDVEDPMDLVDNVDIPIHYILTPSGNFSAISSSDSILWTFNISQSLSLCDSIDDDVVDVDDVSCSWFHLWYDENSDSLVALSHAGHIVSIDPNGPTGELIGSFDNGIQCAAWSMDGEVLALVTFQLGEGEVEGEQQQQQQKLPTLMTMNTQFEVLSEIHLPSHKVSESISICWNQKFDNPLIAVSSHDVEDNTRKIRIYKQAETLEMVSTGRTEDGSGKLIPHILNHATASSTGTGTCSIAWAGHNTSNLLAFVQKKGRRGRNIVFIEPNGLQHGGFKIEQREDHEEVVGLNWNADSDILAITLLGSKKISTRTGTGDDSDGGDYNIMIKYGKLQLYHRSNYHWYLKHEIQYDDEMSISSVKFDQVKGYHFTVALQNHNDVAKDHFHEWRHYRFVWDTSTTSPTIGTASVIDGKHLNMTAFQRAIVPPPMYSSRLSFDSAVISVAYVPNWLTNIAMTTGIEFMVQLSSGIIAFCGSGTNIATSAETYGKSRSLNTTPTIQSKMDLSCALTESGLPFDPSWDSSCLRQLLIVDMKLDGDGGDDVIIKLLSVSCSVATQSSMNITEALVYITIQLSINSNEMKTAKILDINRIQLEGTVLRIVNWSNLATTIDNNFDENDGAVGGALIELSDGSLFQFSINGQLLPCESEPTLLEPCPWIAGLYSEDGRHLVIGLSSRSRLYCGERQLCDASSSFCLSPATGFVSYVTLGSRSQLRYVPLNVLMDFDPLMGSDVNVEILGEGYEPRNVERGSRLVSIMPDKITTVLQLPRGNLEAVYPRALVLPRIMSLIKNGEYHLALDMMRRQKVDMNLIVDMNPSRFLDEEDGVETMVKQVKKMDHLNLFIASLANADFTLWKYPIPNWLRHELEEVKTNEEDLTKLPPHFDFNSKVNMVCEKMRDVMVDMERSGAATKGQFLLPILSTFAKQTPPKLEEALSLIQETSVNQSMSKNKKLLSDKTQSSIQYLAFLADYELLFDRALGMYDFDLAKAVARNSQMDPKVYLPMLKRLKSLPEFEAKYEVDVWLKRYESALTHLFKLGIPENTSEYDVKISEDHFLKCKTFIEKHQMHKLGLKLFINHSQYHGQILISLGESLLNEKKADLALAIFLAAKPRHFDGAKRAARTCGDWKTFFACAKEDPDSSSEDIKGIALKVADEVLSGFGGLYTRKEKHNAAARILFDYCNDIGGAIDMLMSAENWFEARRLASLSNEPEYQKGIIDAAVSYSQSCLPDFYERAQQFIESNKRYAEVVIIRKEAIRSGEAPMKEDLQDETGSLFSLATNASNTSVRSNMSSSSVGSVSSISSVISAGATSTFSLINDDATRHKSKFNSIGKKKKKKPRRTRRERMRPKPGSEEELNSVIATLKENVVDEQYFLTIIETIKFLAQVGMFALAKDLYLAYEDLKLQIFESQRERSEESMGKEIEDEKTARREGQPYEKVTLNCEVEINKLGCKPLPQMIHDLLSFHIE
mmetsp:Transcript_23669/g.27368  ORF Transcript_23669/g.27368 Transcript_23669/m.27368 type:complete len:1514 (+) Transcript_23669:153-4694(+)